MGVLVARGSVGGPPSVPQAGLAFQRGKPPLQLSDLPLVLMELNSAVKEGDAGGVVAAILEPLEGFKDYGEGWSVPCVADDAAHLDHH